MFRAIFSKALRHLTTAVGFASPNRTSSTPFLQNLYKEDYFFSHDALLSIRDQLLPASALATPGPGS